MRIQNPRLSRLLRRLGRTTLVFAGAATLSLVAVAINVATGGTIPWLPAVADHPLWWMAGSTVLAAVVDLLRERLNRSAPTAAEAAGKLADRMQRELAVYLHSSTYPTPMRVRWQRVQEPWADHWVNAVGAVDGPAAPGSGSYQDLPGLWAKLAPGRLVIVGPAGAGKTVLAAQLTQALLPADRQRVPVMVSMASWDPGTGFDGWLADELARTFPELDTRDDAGTRLADVLVGDGRILPVLDGFDELSAAARAAAIRVLNADHQRPLVLTSRPEQYTEAVRTSSAELLEAAAVIMLDPVTVEEVASYLGRSTRRTTAEGRPWWDEVTDALHDDGATGLRGVLTGANRRTVRPGAGPRFARTARTTDHGGGR